MKEVLAIAAVDLRRFTRDRTNLVMSFVLPIGLILLLGFQFGGEQDARVGVAGAIDGEVAAAVLAGLDPESVVVVPVEDEQALAERVESSDLDAGVAFPAGLDDAVAAGGPAEIGVVTASTRQGQQLAAVLDGALTRALAVPTAARAAVERGAAPADALAAAERLAAATPGIRVRSVDAGDRLFAEDLNGVDIAAPSQLVLFLFITGLTGAADVIRSRDLGVTRRILSTPNGAGRVVAGEALGRLAIALVQGAYVVAATMLLFRVDWGDPLGAAAVLVAFAAVSSGAAMLLGAVFRSAELASGVGTVVGLSLAALGGAMLPIELFGDTLADVARATPHFWALDGFADLIRHDAGLADVLRPVAVLLAMAAALLAVAAWRMRRVITRG